MVKVRGKEFIRYLISWLIRNGIKDIVVCAGSLSGASAADLKSWLPAGAELTLSIERRPLGTAGAVRHALPLLADEFILINGDTYLPVPYEDILSHWQKVKTQFDCLLLTYDNHDKVAPNDTAIDSNGLVVGYSKTCPEGMLYANAGLIVTKKNVFENLPPEQPISLEEQVFPDLISRRKMAAITTRERYYDIGTPERLRVFEEYVDQHPHILSEMQ
jgi:MurNAc alpha-1-phosphate uridylyltransferase